MDQPSLSIEYEAVRDYMFSVTASIASPYFCHKFPAHSKCAADMISGTLSIDTQDEESTDTEYMIAIISLLVIGFQPPVHLCLAIQRALYARHDLLNHVMDHDEIGPVLTTRLKQLGQLLRVGDAE